MKILVFLLAFPFLFDVFAVLIYACFSADTAGYNWYNCTRKWSISIIMKLPHVCYHRITKDNKRKILICITLSGQNLYGTLAFSLQSMLFHWYFKFSTEEQSKINLRVPWLYFNWNIKWKYALYFLFYFVIFTLKYTFQI